MVKVIFLSIICSLILQQVRNTHLFIGLYGWGEKGISKHFLEKTCHLLLLWEFTVIFNRQNQWVAVEKLKIQKSYCMQWESTVNLCSHQLLLNNTLKFSRSDSEKVKDRPFRTVLMWQNERYMVSTVLRYILLLHHLPSYLSTQWYIWEILPFIYPITPNNIIIT